ELQERRDPAVFRRQSCLLKHYKRNQDQTHALMAATKSEQITDLWQQPSTVYEVRHSIKSNKAFEQAQATKHCK
ncbi:hypothetical protein U1Q18_049072, partial [Sarracenia purpurea var. burkii]